MQRLVQVLRTFQLSQMTTFQVTLCVSVCVCVCASDVLGRCVYTAYKARRALLHCANTAANTAAAAAASSDVGGGRLNSCLTLCDRASRLLSHSISQLDTAPQQPHHINKVLLPQLVTIPHFTHSDKHCITLATVSVAYLLAQ